MHMRAWLASLVLVVVVGVCGIPHSTHHHHSSNSPHASRHHLEEDMKVKTWATPAILLAAAASSHAFVPPTSMPQIGNRGIYQRGMPRTAGISQAHFYPPDFAVYADDVKYAPPSPPTPPRPPARRGADQSSPTLRSPLQDRATPPTPPLRWPRGRTGPRIVRAARRAVATGGPAGAMGALAVQWLMRRTGWVRQLPSNEDLEGDFTPTVVPLESVIDSEYACSFSAAMYQGDVDDLEFSADNIKAEIESQVGDIDLEIRAVMSNKAQNTFMTVGWFTQDELPSGFIAFRGTTGNIMSPNWRNNINAGSLVDERSLGLWESYSSLREEVFAGLEEVFPNPAVAFEQLPGGITITGHSLGGAMATFCGMDVNAWFRNHGIELPFGWVRVVTFGQPREFNPQMAARVDATLFKLRYVSENDPVPSLPFSRELRAAKRLLRMSERPEAEFKHSGIPIYLQSSYGEASASVQSDSDFSGPDVESASFPMGLGVNRVKAHLIPSYMERLDAVRHVAGDPFRSRFTNLDPHGDIL